jgi:RNA polymerase sigma-70 factor, ECF subfamily
VHSDGGGKVSAARVVIRGRDKVARFLTGVFRKRWFQDIGMATVNGEPGRVFRSGGRVVSVLSLRVEGDVRAVYITVNPDKLGRWAAAEVE